MKPCMLSLASLLVGAMISLLVCSIAFNLYQAGRLGSSPSCVPPLPLEELK